MRKTKIICTLGPKSDNYDTIKAMVKAGMNVVRINMSHGTYDEHKAKIDIVKKVRDELKKPIPVMIDLKGPEVRIKTFEKDSIEIKTDAEFIFTTDDIVGNEKIVSVNYENLHKDIKVGDKILLNNGLIEFLVKKIEKTNIHTVALNDGILSSRKSMYVPGVELSMPFLSEKDIEDIGFAISVDADFIAASFVSNAFDLKEIRSLLKRKKANIEIIAKIESEKGVENIEEIMKESDGIMVARGDMGVEIAFQKLPAIQKRLINKGRMLGKRVIVATEMLESMIENPRPTRAEISDVANAVYDGASCVMLSGESAVGKDPVNVVKVMSNIVEEAESDISYAKAFKSTDFNFDNNIRDAISHSTCNTAIDLKAKAIIVFTNSGVSARMISRFRVNTPIIGVTTTEKIYRRLALSWGVMPMVSQVFNTTDEMFEHARKCALASGLVKSGELVVIVAGVPVNKGVVVNLIKVEQID